MEISEKKVSRKQAMGYLRAWLGVTKPHSSLKCDYGDNADAIREARAKATKALETCRKWMPTKTQHELPDELLQVAKEGCEAIIAVLHLKNNWKSLTACAAHNTTDDGIVLVSEPNSVFEAVKAIRKPNLKLKNDEN